MESEHHRSYKAGIAYILTAWWLFTLTTLIARFASQRISIATILLFQNAIGLLSVLPWLKKHGFDLLRTENFGLIAFRSLISLVAIALSFFAIKEISIVNTMLLTTTSPLWIPFIVRIWRKTPINHLIWPGLICGFLGIFLILRPGKEIYQLGALLALVAGILQGFNMISLRLLSYSVRNHTVMFYYFLICSIICIPLSLFTWIQPTTTEWIEIFAMGIFFTLGQWAFVRAFHHAKASQLGFFCYSAVVYSVILDWVLYAKVPDILSWIGILLVSLGGIWAMSLYHNRS